MQKIKKSPYVAILTFYLLTPIGKMKPKLFFAALIASLGGLLFGFETAVISGAEQTLSDIYRSTWWGLNASWWHGFLVTSSLLGTIIGAMTAGKPADKYGRRKCLFTVGILFLASSLGCAYAWDYWSFSIFRFIGGVAVGGASVIAPMYTSELAPAKVRGRLVALVQFNIVFGILLAYLSNYAISLFGLDPLNVEWRWMFGVMAIPSVLFFALLFLIPRSPRWLVANGKRDEAKDVMISFSNDTPEEVEQELKDIEESLDLSHHSVKERFFQKAYMKPILLVIAIAAFNQLSGINAVIYYSKRIFEMTGTSGENAMLSSIVLGLTNLVFTMAALLVIDKFGRKKLMLAGSVGYIISLGVITWAFFAYGDQFTTISKGLDVKESQAAIGKLCELDKEEYAKIKSEGYPLVPPKAKDGVEIAKVRDRLADEVKKLGAAELAYEKALAVTDGEVKAEDIAGGSNAVLYCLLLFIASHAFGQGAVIWVFISEIFPNRLRARGQALGSSTHWVMAAAISMVFPYVAGLGGQFAFALFTVCMVGQLVWVLVAMPETKGIPLEEIQKKLGIE